MKIVSKFLTADVRLTGISYAGGRIEMTGMVKDFMPVRIEVTAADLRSTVPLVRAELQLMRRRLIARVKQRCRSR